MPHHHDKMADHDGATDGQTTYAAEKYVGIGEIACAARAIPSNNTNG